MFIFDIYEKWQKIIALFKVNAIFSWFSIKARYMYLEKDLKVRLSRNEFMKSSINPK